MVNEVYYKVFKWTAIILTIIAAIAIFGWITNKDYIKKENYIIQIDTVYNKVRLDSIEYNIIKLDSTVVKLKVKYDEVIEKSYNLGDSAAVELFFKLVDSTD